MARVTNEYRHKCPHRTSDFLDPHTFTFHFPTIWTRKGIARAVEESKKLWRKNACGEAKESVVCEEIAKEKDRDLIDRAVPLCSVSARKHTRDVM